MYYVRAFDVLHDRCSPLQLMILLVVDCTYRRSRLKKNARLLSESQLLAEKNCAHEKSTLVSGEFENNALSTLLVCQAF